MRLAYVEFEFYKENGDNTLTEIDFKKLARRAGQQMEYYTFDRIIEVELTDRIRLCACEIIDHLLQVAKIHVEGKGAIKSESVLNLSVAYATSEHTLPENAQSVIQSICQRYLTRPENLMYVGMLAPGQ